MPRTQCTLRILRILMARWKHQAVLYATRGARRDRDADEAIDRIIARTDQALGQLQTLADRMVKGEQ